MLKTLSASSSTSSRDSTPPAETLPLILPPSQLPFKPKSTLPPPPRLSASLNSSDSSELRAKTLRPTLLLSKPLMLPLTSPRETPTDLSQNSQKFPKPAKISSTQSLRRSTPELKLSSKYSTAPISSLRPSALSSIRLLLPSKLPMLELSPRFPEESALFLPTSSRLKEKKVRTSKNLR